MSIDRPLVGAIHRLSVGAKFDVGDLESEFVTVRLKIELYPPDMVFGRVGMGDFFSQSYGHIKEFIRIYPVRTFDNRNVFF